MRWPCSLSHACNFVLTTYLTQSFMNCFTILWKYWGSAHKGNQFGMNMLNAMLSMFIKYTARHTGVITSGSTVIVRTLAALHWRFRNLIKTLLRILWRSNQPVAKASTYTGHLNTETQGQTYMPRAVFENTIRLTKRPKPMPQTAKSPGLIYRQYCYIFNCFFLY
jgi:hypothetical protein